MTFNYVSGCCHREIISTTKLEYPLGGTTWYESYKVDVCEGCGLEVDEPLAVTECCGVANPNGIIFISPFTL